ncbi:hypothetical protein D3C72_2149900 [compost metagenome]
MAGLTVKAGPALAYMEATIRDVGSSKAYIEAVEKAVSVPSWRDSDAQEQGGR